MRHRKYFIIFPILIFLSIPLIIMFLWNNVAIALFPLPLITYFQSLGLFILTRILFGGFSFRPPRKPPFAGRFLKEKWLNMSDAERERFKEEWKKRKNNCG
ncbi:MAG: hypothetical protein H6567_09575 [Lewinellaceae bacterium]|nr:hypothetical protein [Lewinellaceae bacterium]